MNNRKYMISRENFEEKYMLFKVRKISQKFPPDCI